MRGLMSYDFELQQKKFTEVFESFYIDFPSPCYMCGQYNETKLARLLNNESLNFLTTVFCDSLMNSFLFFLENKSLKTVLNREHFSFNRSDIFETRHNSTNKTPQAFFTLWKRSIEDKDIETIYSITKLYLIAFYEPLRNSIGEEKAKKLYQALMSDEDLTNPSNGLSTKIVKSYERAFLDALSSLEIKK